jgi:hypothetical protein
MSSPTAFWSKTSFSGLAGVRFQRQSETAMGRSADDEETQRAPYELVNKSKKLLRVAVLNGRGAVFKWGSDFNAVE